MSFLTPWYLLGLLGMGIPLAIHLIRRQKAERIVLPTVRFLKKAPKKLVHFQKLQQWLLLALRVAMAGLLAVAFARPFLSGAVPRPLGGTPQSLVIELDTSMSMRYGDRFAEAKAKVRELLSSLNPGDEAAVITFSDHPGPMHPLTTDLAGLKAFVDSLAAAGYHATHFLPALRMADQMLRSAGNRGKTICMVSDFQRSGASGDSDPWILSPGIQFKRIQVGEADSLNLAVTDVTITAHPTASKETHSVVGRIQSFGIGSAQASNTRAWLEIDGRQAADAPFDITPGSEHVVTFSIAVTDSGMHSGVLHVQGDRFEPDNRRFFSFQVAPPLRVLLVTDKPLKSSKSDDPAIWLRTALGGHPEAMFQVDVSDIRTLRADALGPYAAAVLLDVGHADPDQTRALIAYAKGGGGLLLAPADGVDPEDFNGVWEDVAPALLRRKQIMTGGAALAITGFQKHHGIIRSLLNDGIDDFGATRFFGYWETGPIQGSEVMLTYENGQPAMLEKTVGNGRVLLFTSSLDPTWNNFPRQVMFLPMMQETTAYLAGRREQKNDFQIGDIVPLTVPRQGVARITSPAGHESMLQSNREDTVFFDATDEPGLYETHVGSRVEPFSVNVSPGESDFASMSAEEIQNRVILSETKQAAPDEAQASALQVGQEASQQNWWWLLLLVFGLGFVETQLANRTYR
jgi:hypothetical protein